MFGSRHVLPDQLWPHLKPPPCSKSLVEPRTWCSDCEPGSSPWLASPAPPSPPSSSEVPVWFPDCLGFLAHSMLFPSLCLGLGYLIHMVWLPTSCPTSFLFFQWTPAIFKSLLELHLHQEVFSTPPYWAVFLGISQKPLQNWTIGCGYKLPSESL